MSTKPHPLPTTTGFASAPNSTSSSAMHATGATILTTATVAAPKPPPTHVVFCLPGMWGNPKNLECLATMIRNKNAPSSIIVVVSRVNSLAFSYHGVDVCGTRLAEEVKAFAAAHPHVRQISFVCYSAGGLFARYAVGILWHEGLLSGKGDEWTKEKKSHSSSRSDKVHPLQPLVFITLATPHCGCREVGHTAHGRRRNRIQSFFTDFYCYRTGRQIMLMDFDSRSSNSSSSSSSNNSSSSSSNNSSNDKSRRNFSLPLLLQISLPSSPFYKGLAAFCDIAFYANASNDHVVHYATAAVARSNPYHDLPCPPEEEEGGMEEWEGSTNSSRPRKYKYVVRETRIDLEEAAWKEQKEKEMQVEKKKKEKKNREDGGSTEKNKKKTCEISHGENGDKEDEEEEEKEEEKEDEEDVQTVENLPTSHYSPLHPLALPVLFPFIALHALLLMAPFRLVAGLTASDSPALPPSLPPSHPPVEIDEVPEIIRRHLSCLPINRVDVFLPGIHTHAKIVVRRPRFGKEGMGVLEHVAARIGRVRIREGGKEG